MTPFSKPFSRRDFLGHCCAVGAGSLLLPQLAETAPARADNRLPIVVFSKVYQTLSLNFEDAAQVTAEAGLDGVDIPVRPKGEVEPERVTEDLPKYAAALKKHHLTMPLLATAILSPSTPHAEAILTTAKKFGARYYRLGFVDRESDVAAQIREVRARLKDLAALNKKLGMTALLQNHSPAGHTYLGGDLSELSQLLEDFDPEQFGAAFDIGHALIVHKDQWRPHFERIKSHLKIAYVKDANKNGRWVPFGEGDVGQSGYFKLLKQLGYKAPLSLHIEYDWHRAGKANDRPTLVNALRESSTRLRKWLEES